VSNPYSLAPYSLPGGFTIVLMAPVAQSGCLAQVPVEVLAVRTITAIGIWKGTRIPRAFSD
jgi:hypothetical protein